MKNSKDQILALGVIVAIVIAAFIFWPPNLGPAEGAIHDLTVCRDDGQAYAHSLKQDVAEGRLNPYALGEAKERYDQASARIHGCIEEILTEIDAGITEERAAEIGAHLQDAYDQARAFRNWFPGPSFQGAPPVSGGAPEQKNYEMNTVKEVAETFKSLVKFSVDMRREVNKDRIDALKKRLESLRWAEFDAL
jgi:hypothetical protein